jgi:hypothetical protein
MTQREGYELNGEYGRFHSVDYPDYDECPTEGCHQTRAWCENMAEGCAKAWVDPESYDDNVEPFDSGYPMEELEDDFPDGLNDDFPLYLEYPEEDMSEDHPIG